MTRLLPTVSALMASIALMTGIAALAAVPPLPRPQPRIIGAEKPVFLGTMVVRATAL
ncbi:hypothetical protein [Novosphingobium resinovorum]|uniref:hypothetical protein n=1 Tax=Novosphingobium resinovorum TaxID=158500 RepID=UPI002ECFDA63|nr:hypothetical protein [Novosphingobium resinovorum]